jgi:hypothetical protein
MGFILSLTFIIIQRVGKIKTKIKSPLRQHEKTALALALP